MGDVALAGFLQKAWGPVSPPPAAVQGVGQLVVLLSGCSSLRPWASPPARCSVDWEGL